MARPYVVTITNGSGTSEAVTGEYTVTANVAGYDSSTIDPANLTITEDTSSYSFTVAATGTLVLHVSEEGIEGGTPVVGATFYRCDSEGTTYGDAVISDDEGNATFQHVPFSAEGDAPTIYYKQTASDDAHDFELTLQNTTLSEESSVVEVFNPPVSTKTLSLTDANYSGLPIENAEITLS